MAYVTRESRGARYEWLCREGCFQMYTCPILVIAAPFQFFMNIVHAMRRQLWKTAQNLGVATFRYILLCNPDAV